MAKKSSCKSNTTNIIVKSNTFKSSDISYILNLPCNSPEIHRIIRSIINPKINEISIINTPIGISNEGQKLTGKKALVIGYLCIKIEYETYDTQEPIYLVNFDIPFCEYIVINPMFDGCICMNASIDINESMLKKIDENSILLCINMFLRI